MLVAAAANVKALNAGFEELRGRGAEWLRGEGGKSARAKYGWLMDMRYFGQNFELILELKSDGLDERALAKVVEAFHHQRHHEFYGYDMRGAAGRDRQPAAGRHRRAARADAREAQPARATVKDAVIEKRKVWFPGNRFRHDAGV